MGSWDAAASNGVGRCGSVWARDGEVTDGMRWEVCVWTRRTHPMMRETMYCALFSIRGDASSLPSSVAT